MPTNVYSQAQVEGLATLLVLNDELKKLSSVKEFAFFTTNETHQLVPYHTGFMWEDKNLLGMHITAQSGVAEVDSYAPANQWLKTFIKKLAANSEANNIHSFDFSKDSADAKLYLDEELLEHWPASLPHYVLWCPLFDKENSLVGGLLFLRETPFVENEIKMLTWLLNSYQYTWKILMPRRRLHLWQLINKKPYLQIAAVVIAVIILFPTQMTSFATGTVVPSVPAYINAPMEGVIQSFAVTPGEYVKPGQLLVSLDKTDLQATAEVSQKDYLLTQTKLRTAMGAGLDNKADRAEIPVLQAQLAIDKVRLDYTNAQLAKADITSPTAGIAVFNNKEDLIGQPVHAGERILVIADPKRVKLKIALPVAELIRLQPGNTVEFYPYGQLSSLPLKLTTLGYNARYMPNKMLAYELTAKFDQLDDVPQIGAQGVVKIYGRYVPFIYYLVRRPLQSIRYRLGI